jgi:hypothetical protein
MMNFRFLLVQGVTAICSLTILGCGLCAKPSTELGFTPGQLPASFYTVKCGMTDQNIQAVLGKPRSMQVNPHFETKSDAEWDQIQSKVDSEKQAELDPSSIPDPNFTKLNAELEHRVKVIWVYDPAPRIWASICFDGHNTAVMGASGIIPVNTHAASSPAKT